MGNWWSDAIQSEAEEITQVTTHNPFRYPPKGGISYFGSHFIMGGERFETFGDSYLFGDNSDLNFLGGKPVAFPYPAPTGTEPTKTLKALMYIRKETIKFVRVPDSKSYNIEFTFDADCRCQITLMYFCREELTPSGVVYRPQDPKLCSEPLKFKAGTGQQFTNTEHNFTPSIFSESDLQYDPDVEVYPVVIHCVALTGEEQSHSTTAYIDKHGEDTYILKPLKQKLFVDGLAYLLQEIYGIENKHSHRQDDDSQNAECVVCLSETRDTLILPCRHLCLCHSCADSLRYQAQLCPICRSPFRALLQIRAVYKVPPPPVDFPTIPPDMPVIQMNQIPGFEIVPLIEALNGPFRPSDLSQAAASLAIQAARVLSEDKSDCEIEKPSSIPLKVIVAPAITKEENDLNDTSTGIDKDNENSGGIEVDSNIFEASPDMDNPDLHSHVRASSESCGNTPTSKHGFGGRHLSLPTSPNLTAGNSAPVSATTISTRSSGDSLTSSCSTKQLLTTPSQQSEAL